MNESDPLSLRSARAWTGDPHVRWASLTRVRDDIVSSGRLDLSPFTTWLGDDIGTMVFEACVRSELDVHCVGRSSVAVEALCALLDVLEEGASLRAVAVAQQPELATQILARALEQRFVAPWSSRVMPPIARFTAPSEAPSPEAPPPRPLESALRARLAGRRTNG